jgi:hypothetical protein
MKAGWIHLGILVSLVALSTGCLDFGYILGTFEETACDNVDPSSISPGFDRSHCFKDAAERKKTPETCAKVEESAPRTRCYMELAEELGRWQLCDNLQDQPSGQDYSRLECVQRAAVKTFNTSICEEMGDASYGGWVSATYSKEECIKAVNAAWEGKDLPPGSAAPGGSID